MHPKDVNVLRPGKAGNGAKRREEACVKCLE